MKPFLWLGALAFILVTAACNDAPKPAEKAKEPAKPAEPVTGRYALYQMYQVARTWSGDLEILQVANIPLSDLKSTESKSGAWQATFASPSKSKARTYTYSVIEAGATLHKGVFAGLEEAYSGPRGQTKPFPIAAAKIDTDAAFETAKTKSADYIKKFPTKPVNYRLEWTSRYPDPAWRVFWGETLSTSDYSIFVDAATGDFLGKAH
jgi:hypothetical protein